MSQLILSANISERCGIVVVNPFLTLWSCPYEVLKGAHFILLYAYLHIYIYLRKVSRHYYSCICMYLQGYCNLSLQTFNEFFIRQLKPSARPIAHIDDDSIATCAADCRLMAYSSVDESTRFWIKVRHCFTSTPYIGGVFF